MKKCFLFFSAWLLIAIAGYTQIESKAGPATDVSLKIGPTLADKLEKRAVTSHLRKRIDVADLTKLVPVPNLTPTILMNDLNFNSASTNTARDFLVTVNETNNVATQGTITFRIVKLSAFTITYSVVSGNSDVYPGTANSNSDWNFSETDSYITVTSKSGVTIGANNSKIIGFNIIRKAAIAENTRQNITVSIVANSGGEQDASDNITGTQVMASETPAPFNFTIAAESIKLNPYGYTPLSALVNFSASALGKTFIRVRGKSGTNGRLTNVEHTFDDYGLRHSIPLMGMYANYTNTVDIRIVGTSGDTLAKSTITIQTGGLPPNMPTSIVATPFDATKVDPALILVSNYSTYNVSNPYIPYFMDAYGEIRWVLDYRTHTQLNMMNYEDGISRLKNGNFFFGDSNPNASAIYEVDLLGNVINSWPTTGYLFHHEVYEKPNGNFLLTATKSGSTYKNGTSPTVEDFVIEIDRQSKAITTVWDLKQSLDETRDILRTQDGAQPASDWFHGNAVLYDATDNTIVVSGRTQGVVKLDYNNQVKWILAPHAGWNKNRRGEDLNQFLLQPLDASGNPISNTAVINGTAITSDFEWNWYEHNHTYLPNGDLLMFDNGSVREFNPSATTKYSRAVSYKIDPANMTVKQTWTYGQDRGTNTDANTNTYSRIVSSAQFLPQTNHILFSPGYQVPNASGGAGSKVVEVDFATKQTVSQINITAANGFGHHRAIKMSIYP